MLLIVATIVGLFLAALAISTISSNSKINWNKLQIVSEDIIITLTNAMTLIPAIGNTSDQTAASITMTSFGIPFTSNMSSGFTIGFMRG